MRHGGIFDVPSAVGEIDEGMEQFAEEWSREALTPTLRVPGQITDLDSDADRAAIIAADQAILDKEKAALARSGGAGGWFAGLSDLGKLSVVVGGIFAAWYVYKAATGKARSYASNPRKRRRSGKRRYSANKRHKTYPAYRAMVGLALAEGDRNGAIDVADAAPAGIRERLWNMIQNWNPSRSLTHRRYWQAQFDKHLPNMP